MKITVPILTAVALVAAPFAAVAQETRVETRIVEEQPPHHHHHHHRRYHTVKVVKYINGERVVTYKRVYYN